MNHHSVAASINPMFCLAVLLEYVCPYVYVSFPLYSSLVDLRTAFSEIKLMKHMYSKNITALNSRCNLKKKKKKKKNKNKTKNKRK